jgi:hypothetical protein
MTSRITSTSALLRISLIILTLILMVNAPSMAASGLSNARAAAMAGAQLSLAKGYYSPSFNPANLGISTFQMRGMQVFGAGVSFSNNSLSLDDYNRYTGAHLSEADKRDLLSKIPSEGLKASGDGEVSALGFARGNMAVSLSAVGAAEINMNRSVIELLLNGNTYGKSVDMEGIYGDGYGLASLNFSYGHTLYKDFDRQLAVGATVRLIKGLVYEEIMEANGEAVTLATGFDGAGNLVTRTASGGTGFSVDLGATLQLNKDYTTGAAIHNFASAIRWNKDTEEHHYQFDFDTLTAVNMDNDSIITTVDTVIAVDPFTTNLPSSIRLGLAKTRGTLLWAVDWEQGFKLAAGTSPTPRVSTGLEYRFLSFLPVRAGFGLGGKQGTTFAGGIGFDFAPVNLDVGVANYNAVVGSSGKGINFAITGGVHF